MARTWLITGCSTGFGKALASEVAVRGERVVATARNVASLAYLDRYDNALAVALDVTDKAAIENAVAAANDRFGGVDVLVNNAGFGLRGAVEEASDAEIAGVFGTNFFGPINLIKAVLPKMRENRSGTIVNFSSIAAFRTAEGSGYYGATKAALEAASDALAKEVAPLGIRVMVVEPGPFRTDFAGRSLSVAALDIADYAETAGKRKQRNDPHAEWRLGSPEKAARLLADLCGGNEPLPFRLLLGSDAVRLARAHYEAQAAEVECLAGLSTETDE